MFTNYPHPQPVYNSEFLAMSKLPGLKSRGLSLSFLPCSQDAPKCEDGEPALVLGDDDNDGPAIVAMYNDFVLCCTMEYKHRDYNICNPYTKQWVVLPPAPRSHKTVKVGFIFDPYCFKGTNTTGSSDMMINAEYRCRVVRIPF